MALTPRQQQILEWLKLRSSASTEEMRQHSGVSIAPIYRDARTLMNTGAVQRVTGGLATALPGDQIQTHCRFCGKPVRPRPIFLIQTRDGAAHHLLPTLRSDGLGRE